MYTSYFTVTLFFFTSIGFSQLNNSTLDFSALEAMQVDTLPKIQFTESYDGVNLGYYTFCPKDTTVAKLIFYHGGGAHSKLGYFKLAIVLRDVYNIQTTLVDIRGHGYSEGKRGDCPTVNSLYKDINSIIVKVKDDTLTPLYIGGHSSGAGLVLNYSNWKSKLAIDGYFFISPEFGYKSDTKRDKSVEFTEVSLWKFIVNSISQGLLFPHGKAVFFNYPETILQANPLLLQTLSITMAKAQTPKHPQKQFKNIHHNIAIIIGEKDELLDPKKVIEYSIYNKNKTIKIRTHVIKMATHLSILNTVGIPIGKTIQNWN